MSLIFHLHVLPEKLNFFRSVCTVTSVGRIHVHHETFTYFTNTNISMWDYLEILKQIIGMFGEVLEGEEIKYQHWFEHIL